MDLGEVGFGAEQLGGFGWGEFDMAEASRAVVAAADAGVRFFDTADCYGAGLSEQRLGPLLAAYGDGVLIGTKGGVRLDAQGRARYDNTPQWLRQAALDSRVRLGVERIGLYQLHHRDHSVPLGEALGAMQRLVDEGIVDSIGVSNVDPEELSSIPPGVISTVSWEWSLVARGVGNAAREQITRGRRFIGYGTLGQGVLSGKYRDRSGLAPGDRRHRGAYGNFHDRLDANLVVVDALRDVAAGRSGRTPASVAIRWAIQALPGAVPLVGIKRQSQLDDLLFAREDQLTSAEMGHLQAAAEPR